jgi:hypothetical protein
MLLRRTFRVVALLTPLLLFVLVLTLTSHSVRLSLILHGHPFARVVSKERLDIFKFVRTDSFACRAIVFSNEKAVGWISTAGGFPSFVPFSDKPNLDGDDASIPWFDLLLMFAWFFRWWLLAAQAIVLLLWFREKRRSSFSRMQTGTPAFVPTARARDPRHS